METYYVREGHFSEDAPHGVKRIPGDATGKALKTANMSKPEEGGDLLHRLLALSADETKRSFIDFVINGLHSSIDYTVLLIKACVSPA